MGKKTRKNPKQDFDGKARDSSEKKTNKRLSEKTAKEKNKNRRSNSSKHTTSIARRINFSFWLKRLGDMVFIDFLLVGLVSGCFFYYCEDQAAEKQRTETGVVSEASDGKIETRYFVIEDSITEEENNTDSDSAKKVNNRDSGSVKEENNTDSSDTRHGKERWKGLTYVIRMTEGHEYKFPMYPYFYMALYGAVILLAVQGIHLFFALFQTSEIRRKLKPLNDLAVKAEEMSSMPFDPGKFESLEQAIEHISPDGPEASIHTGDKDLQSIEVALNNLLQRMKESQMQQTRFVSDASHELRTPIAVIQGYVNMLDRWGKEDESVLEESIEALKNESQHMKELVEQLLFLARGDSGRNTLNKTVFDLNDVIREVWEESAMIDSGHRYVLEEQPEAYTAGDVAMIKQSVRIFIQNAAKYSAQGDTIRLAVALEPEHVCYIIQDEGIGMRDSEVIHIFERFYRSDQARNGETGGSGLGLSIAKWIIDAHEGVIEVLSRSEFGTRFTVRLERREHS